MTQADKLRISERVDIKKELKVKHDELVMTTLSSI